MNIISDLKLVYKKVSKDFMSRIAKNPIFLLMPLVYFIVYIATNIIFNKFIGASLGMLSGFILPIINSIIISSYFSILDDLINYNRIYLKNIGTSFQRYFGSVYSAYIILIIISWVLLSLSQIQYLFLIVGLVLMIAFNPLAEAVYIRGEYYLEAYKYSYDFIRENHLIWFIPFFIYLIIIGCLGVNIMHFVFTSNVIDIPLGIGAVSSITTIFNLVNVDIIMIIKLLLISVITGAYGLFRGLLFKILHKSSRRKRAYMGEL